MAYERNEDESSLRSAVGNLLEAYDIGIVNGCRVFARYDAASRRVVLKGKDCRIERLDKTGSELSDLFEITGTDTHGCYIKGSYRYRIEF